MIESKIPICFPDPHFFLRFSGRGIPSTRAETEPGNQCIPRLKSGISYRYFRRLFIQFITSPKTNMDTQNDGLEKVTPLLYGHFWYLTLLNFWGVLHTSYLLFQQLGAGIIRIQGAIRTQSHGGLVQMIFLFQGGDFEVPC